MASISRRADAGPVEHEFDRDRSRQRGQDRDADAGRQRQQRVAQPVAVDDPRPRARPWRARCGHSRCPSTSSSEVRVSRPMNADLRNASVSAGRKTWCSRSQNPSPAPLIGNQPRFSEKTISSSAREIEVGHRIADQREERAAVVGRLVALRRGEDAERDADGQRPSASPPASARSCRAGCWRSASATGTFVHQRVAEIEPAPTSDRKLTYCCQSGIVQPHLLAEGRELPPAAHCRPRAASAGIARQDAHGDEDQRQHQEHGRDRMSRSLKGRYRRHARRRLAQATLVARWKRQRA